MVDVAATLHSLAFVRPLFHSEADFQHALAWQVHLTTPGTGIRLEYPVRCDGAEMHVDVWLREPSIALETKYRTRSLSVSVAGENFSLKDHSAQDQGRYDFVLDIWRIERMVTARACEKGVAILLANDSNYWTPAGSLGSFDAAFRLCEGRTLSGTLAWAPTASPGTTQDRETPISLSGTYPLHWMEYSQVTAARAGTFRYLAVTVA